MSKRDNFILLEDIAEAIAKVLKYTKNMNYDAFLADVKTQDAVYRNFEVIGEAANQITEDFKNTYPEIEWKKLSGLRNRIIHEYFGVDNEIIWNIIQSKIEDFKISIDDILQNK
ncbi:MAG: DUF86 domain-containing protein [Bacteroidetes bacterium]|nr:DUF86 domain-containing protein [Bacteroidota bacterium]